MWEAGLSWYSDALSMCRTWRPRDTEYAVAVVATLSPRCPWPRNIELASRYLRGLPIRVMGVTHKKLDRLRGERHPFPSLTGLKVRGFYGAILSGGQGEDVCVDRHAYSIYLGRTSSDKETNILQRPVEYDRVATAYREAARNFGVTPPQCQAITWVWWRDNKASRQLYLGRTAAGA